MVFAYCAQATQPGRNPEKPAQNLAPWRTARPTAAPCATALADGGQGPGAAPANELRPHVRAAAGAVKAMASGLPSGLAARTGRERPHVIQLAEPLKRQKKLEKPYAGET